MASGAEVMMRSSAQYWREAEIDGEILSTGPTPGPYAQTLEAAGYPVHHLPFTKSPGFFLSLYKLVRRGQYDVLHIHCERANFYYALVGWLIGVRVVRTVSSNFAYSGFTASKRKIQRNLLRRMGCWQVSVGPSVRDNERRRLANPTVLITNWYESNRFCPPSEDQRLTARSQYGITEEDFVVVSVGNCAPVKNHPKLIEALACLRKEIPLLYLHVGKEIAGHPERELVEKLGFSDRIRFLGYTEDVLRPLHAADVFVMPSLYEGFSVAAIEGLGTGLFTVLTEVQGLIDLKSVEGIYWATPESDSLAEALRQVARIPRHERARLARRQHQTIRRRYGIERAVRAFVDIYRSRLRASS